MNNLNDFEIDLVLKELATYLDRTNIKSLTRANNLFKSCLIHKYFETASLALKDPAHGVYEERLNHLVKEAKGFVKELTVGGCWDNSWVTYLIQFTRLNTLVLKDLEIDSLCLNQLTRIDNLILDNVSVTNLDQLNIQVKTIQITGNQLKILEYLPINYYNELTLANNTNNHEVINNGGLIIKLNNKKCLTLPVLNQLKKLSNQQITKLTISNINLEITKLAELLGIWSSSLTTLEISKSILFPPSRIINQSFSSENLTKIYLNEVDFKGFNYLEYLIHNSNLNLNLKNSELDKFNVIGFNYELVLI